MARLWLEILPAAATVVGGMILTGTASRVSAVAGGWLGVAAGAWYVVGVPIWSLLTGTPDSLGAPLGGPRLAALEQSGMLIGLGALIAILAALALGRFSVRTREGAAATARRERRRHDGSGDGRSETRAFADDQGPPPPTRPA